MSELKPIVYSGTCLCGHSWKEHHLSMVFNPEVAKVIGDSVPGACLRYGSNETEGLDEQGEIHCFRYVDVDDPDPERIAAWEGTRREA